MKALNVKTIDLKLYLQCNMPILKIEEIYQNVERLSLVNRMRTFF